MKYGTTSESPDENTLYTPPVIEHHPDNNVTKAVSDIFRYNRRNINIYNTYKNSETKIKSIKELKAATKKHRYCIYIKNINNKKHIIKGKLEGATVDIRSAFDLEKFLIHVKEFGAWVTVDKNGVLRVNQSGLSSKERDIIIKGSGYPDKGKTLKFLSDLINNNILEKLESPLEYVDKKFISKTQTPSEAYTEDLGDIGGLLYERAFDSSLSEKERTDCIKKYAKYENRRSGYVGNDSGEKEEKWPIVKACVSCKKEFKEFPNTKPSAFCSLTCELKTREDLNNMLSNGNDLWVRNLSKGIVVLSLDKSGNSRLTIPHADYPVCLTDRAVRKELEDCPDLRHFVARGLLELLTPEKLKSN